MKPWQIDLHIHLDGSISVESAQRLAAMQGITLPRDLKKQLTVDPDCRDLNQYLEKFALPLSLLQTPQAMEYAVSKLLAELQEQGIKYAEIRFAPQLHGPMSQEDTILAAIRGLEQSDIPAVLILCCMRGADSAQNEETVRLAQKYLGQGVAAVDLAGAEALFPTADYESLFDLARSLYVPFTIHAGEADGPDSVRTAISFGAKRIGHGVRAMEDPELVSLIREKGITLECCPTSNLQTRIFEYMEQFPIRKLLDQNIRFTINTDNMTVSGTTLQKEWDKLRQVFSLTEEELDRIARYAQEAAFI